MPSSSEFRSFSAHTPGRNLTTPNSGRDILGVYEVLSSPDNVADASPGHFIGSFVLTPAPPSASLPSFLVVDGQQRLTTITLLLAALREAALANDPVANERITNSYLVNQYKHDDDYWKFVLTDEDRSSYEACIRGQNPGAGKDLISKAYRFFQIQLAQEGPDDKPLDLGLLEQAIVSRLAIVDITAQHGDNVHRIFESLNATGVGLTQADLLRNYLFMLLPSRDKAVYRDVWKPMQDELGVERLEGLARVDLRRRGVRVRDDDVYRAQQARLRPFENDEAAIEAQVRDTSRSAQGTTSGFSILRRRTILSYAVVFSSCRGGVPP